MNVNQKGFDRRLAAVQRIIQQFGLKSSKVTPLAYVEHCPFHFNNFTYRVDLVDPALPSSFAGQPGTSSLPQEGISTIVVRLSNPLASGLNNTNRVENEVASLHLARQSLESSGLPPFIPAIYAWAASTYPAVEDESGFGWLVCEFKYGADLDTQFGELSSDEKSEVIEQIADIVAALQRTKLPTSVTQFGSLKFDEQGEIVSGQMALLEGGPWNSYAEVWRKKLGTKIEEADQSSLLQGWKSRGVREKVDRFLMHGGLDRMLEGVDLSQRVLVHGDLTMNNILFDGATKRITSIIDFDWSMITHPVEEYLSGLWDIGGGIHARNIKFRSNILSGDFTARPEGLSDEEARKWECAQVWNIAIAKRNALRPSTIAGVKGISELKDLEDILAPFHLVNEVVLKRKSEEIQHRQKEETENRILEWFAAHGL